VPESVEVIGGVVRAGSGLGVVLHAEHRAVPQPQPLYYAVVEIDVADHGRAVWGVKGLQRLRWHV